MNHTEERSAQTLDGSKSSLNQNENKNGMIMQPKKIFIYHFHHSLIQSQFVPGSSSYWFKSKEICSDLYCTHILVFKSNFIELSHIKTVQSLVKLLKPGGKILFRDYGLYDLAQLRFKNGQCIEKYIFIQKIIQII